MTNNNNILNIKIDGDCLSVSISIFFSLVFNGELGSNVLELVLLLEVFEFIFLFFSLLFIKE